MTRGLNSLYWKIATIFLVLLLVFGAVQLFISLNSSVSFVAETDQKLNRDLAQRFAPFLADSLNYGAIEHTFHELMVMNPRVEIYLLDEQGNLLAYFAPEEKIKRTSVRIEPIKLFLQAEETTPTPIYGDDPRSPTRQKPFSATSVLIGGQQKGYLYVILGGEQYDSVSSMLQGSYIVKNSAFVFVGIFLCTGLAGLFLFFILTKRLRLMTSAVKRFESGDYQQRIAVGSDDEMGQLGQAFNQMADTIVSTMNTINQNDAMRRELVANVSHDLRTPLASIQGYLETVLIKESELSLEERQRFLDIIYHNVTMLGRLVHELFELSKLDARQTEPQLEPFSLAELAQDVVLDFQAQAQQEGVHLDTLLPQDLPLVHADIGMIERVLTNLIENALHHTPAGQRVALELEPQAHSVEVRVLDTGQGIAPKDLPHIFDRFYRAEKNRAKLAAGTGLGLAIARKIVEAHGGEIAVQSQVNVGTTFSFELTTLANSPSSKR